MDYGESGEYRDDPEHGCHAVEECADDDQNQALGALHEAHAAGSDERLGAGAGVAHHDGAYHDESSEYDVEEAVAAGVEDQQTEKLRGVAIAVNDRIEKRSEAGDAVGGAGYLAIHKIEEAGENDDEAGEEKHVPLRGGVGRAEKDRGPSIYHEAHERQHIGIDARQGQPANDGIEQHAAGATESARP